jgi:hypothetical protein
VEQFNKAEIASIQPQHCGNPAIKYHAVERDRVLRERHRKPDIMDLGDLTVSRVSLAEIAQLV